LGWSLSASSNPQRQSLIHHSFCPWFGPTPLSNLITNWSQRISTFGVSLENLLDSYLWADLPPNSFGYAYNLITDFTASDLVEKWLRNGSKTAENNENW